MKARKIESKGDNVLALFTVACGRSTTPVAAIMEITREEQLQGSGKLRELIAMHFEDCRTVNFFGYVDRVVEVHHSHLVLQRTKETPREAARRIVQSAKQDIRRKREQEKFA